MENNTRKAELFQFYPLKLDKKRQLTKNTYALELEIPAELKDKFAFEAGQYVPVRYEHNGKVYVNDYSMTSAPYEQKLSLGIKVNSPESSVNAVIEKEIGDTIMVAQPQGRFTLVSKPHEFRTILGFAGGIGITPILSHFKNILHKEPRTRLFLFYGNKSSEDIAFREELHELVEQYGGRLQVYYFLSKEDTGNSFSSGRMDEHKLELIINQILHLDDTDEESTIWDSVDEVLICGKGEMIRSLANACHENGIPKKNIHFELFEAFNEDIYPQEKEFPLVENIEVDFKILGQNYTTTIPENKNRLLQSLLIQKFPVPYSCKSGICGSCECKLIEGEVELLENEYLTEKEEEKGHILACMSVVLSKKIKVDFDLI
ncbi:MAG: 2Fe-2S iron-sulfur cluster-binding protein [Bergeyella sp.]